MTLFQQGDFTLASGAKSTWKIECDALTDEDWDGLAAILVSHLFNPFSRVLGVPRGGLPLRRALTPYINHNVNRLLIVDDVWTTGSSMNEYIKSSTHNEPYIDRAVIFARSKVPSNVTALFQMPSPRAVQAFRKDIE